MFTQDEIDAKFEDMDDDCETPDYKAIQSMEYLDMVIHETLRLHPAVAMLQRSALADYKVPG